MQTISDANGIVAEPDFGTQIDSAVIAAIDGDGGIAKRDRAQRMSRARRVALSGRNHVRLRAHVRMASPSRSCGRGNHESGVLLPCRSAPPSPSAIPSTARLADWLPRSSATAAAAATWAGGY